MSHLLSLPALPTAGSQTHWGQLHGCADSFAAAKVAAQHDGPVLLVAGDEQQAYRHEQALRFFQGNAADQSLLHFPNWETLPYDLFSPHQDIVSQRLLTLYRLAELQRGVVLLSLSTLMQRLPPAEYVAANALLLKVGDTLDISALRQRFEMAGYSCVSQVMEHGEFAVRGGLIDLFPMGSHSPYRIDLFDDEIETIRRFDPETQRSAEKLPEIRMLPAREFPLDQDAVNSFRQNYRSKFADADFNRCEVYKQISDGNAPGGVEYFLPLFFDKLATLFDYLPDNTLVILPQDWQQNAATSWEDIKDRYEQRRHDIERPILPPHELFQEPDAVLERLARFPKIVFDQRQLGTIEDGVTNGSGANLASKMPLPLQFNPRAESPAGPLLNFLSDYKGRVLFAADSPGRRETLRELLREHGLRPQQYGDWQAFESDSELLGIAVADLENGIYTDQLAIITEHQLFGDRVSQRRRRKKAARDPASIIRDLTDLNVGSPVVHEDNGVGRYLGLQTLTIGPLTSEYLTLEYAGGDKLYVPVASLHLISRYTGTAPENAPLHKLGSDVWEKAKRKAREKIHDVAAELLEIHAKRAARTGHGMQWDSTELRAFASSFPFEETADQQKAINAVLSDLNKPSPMDRVVCGDVGFGKTEVAMRAAFAAVNAGYQVAMLVPTTLLAQQHYQNFSDRFADWPVRVEVLSRFRTGAQTTKVLADLEAGQVDIVIGTHKLLQDSMKFKQLGLVIIDEEHRFGVRHKEKLKALRAEVDLLTLTATPIPRTLNMGLSGMRDLSIVATPPAERLAVKTFLTEWDKNLVREACQREIRRGGQIYFLHNDVQNMEVMHRELSELLPEARIEYAHGQMREAELEQVMLDFHHRRFDLLLCSTIVESGIDNANANTILINRADKFGLAQLHQLRGRVGRSHHRAYCYLIAPHEKSLTADAKKRLEAIESLEELGAGFTLATHDLEIRGAGELLGDEQSGQIQQIGFALYNELLERAVEAMKAGELPEDSAREHPCEVDLHLPALLPESYVHDVHTRLIMYKRIASAADGDALRELEVELVDRFGLLPEAAKTLFDVTRLKLEAAPFGVRKIDLSASGGRFDFNPKANLDPGKVIALIQEQPHRYRFDGQDRLRIIADLPDAPGRLAAARTLLKQLS